MAALGGNPVQHSTMSRTKKIDKQGVFTGELEVAAGQTATHAVSQVLTQGSAIMYAILLQ